MTEHDEFDKMMFRAVIEDANALLDQVIALEAESRHEMACNDDPVAANAAANQAYALFMEARLRELPTLIMGLADKFNREHEAYTKLLDQVADVQEHLRQYHLLQEMGKVGLAEASVLAAESIIEQAFEDALYEKTTDL